MRTCIGLIFCSIISLALCLAHAQEPKPRAAVALPAAPEECRVRVVHPFTEKDQEPARIAAHPTNGFLYVLHAGGDVTRIDPRNDTAQPVFTGVSYIEQPKRDKINIPLPVDAKWVNAPISLRATLCLGICFDAKGWMYIVANVLIPGPITINRVDIYRCESIDADGKIAKPKLWTRFDYPYGIGGFNHGACRIAQGPDGKIYLGSGSRTDHGEAGDDPSLSKLGESPHPDVPGGPGFKGGDFTASILRFDPAKGQQELEVFSRGNRNPFGFDWDDKGRLIDAEHGPMADHPEELNHIRQGKHYGFPYVFGNNEKPNYPDSPAAPAGLKFEPPIKNLGPGGLLGVDPMYSLSPHAAPGGMIFYRSGSLPKKYDNSFFLARFGNLVNYNRIGFDVLNIRLEEKDGELVANTERFLEGLARPIDLCLSNGKLYIVEYCRQTDSTGPGSAGFTEPGRVLEVAGK